MSKKIKAMAMFTVLTMGLSLFAGCSSKEEVKPETNTETAKPTEKKEEPKKEEPKKEEAKKEEPVNLVWWCIGDQPKDFDKVEAYLNEVLKEKINVTVDMKFASFGEYTEKLSKIIATGEYYDLAFTCSWANPFAPNAQQGAYMPMDDLLAKEGKELQELIPASLWDTVKIDGQIYGVPAYKDTAFTPYMVFSKEFVEKYDVDYEGMSTLEDLEPYLKTLKENETSSAPLVLTNTEGWHGMFDEFDMLLGSNFPLGVQFTDDTCTVVNPLETEVIQNKLGTLHKYYQAGYINQDATTLSEAPKFRFIYGAHGFPYADIDWSTGNGWDTVSTQRYDAYFTTGSAQGSVQAISVNSEHPEEAMKLLNLVNSDWEVRNILAFGIEGEHYKKTGDTSIEVLNDGWGAAQFSQGTFFNMYTVDPAPADKWKVLQEFNDAAKPSPILGFIFNTQPIETEIAVVKNTFEKYRAQLTTGAANPDELLPKVIEELNAAGLDKIIAETQKQVDEWKANK